MNIFIGVVVFFLGAGLVVWTLYSAIRSFVLPRSENVFLTRVVGQALFFLFRMRLKLADTYPERDRIMSIFAPVSLLTLPVVWLTCIAVGYTAMFWAVGVRPLYNAFWLSGSSLLTLGFAPVSNMGEMLLAFSEATIGLGMVALLIAYLPTMFTAFTDRETAVSMLEVRAGDPPSAVEMIRRLHRIKGLDELREVWPKWENWFVELEQTHTSLIHLVFFRSPHTGQSWVVAAGTILDAASLSRSVLDIPRDPHADLCIRAGYLALRNIVDFFGLSYNSNPQPDDPISVTRAEFDAVCRELEIAGVPLKTDRDQAWRDFTGWRVNYDTVLRMLAGLTMAPTAPWSGDRPIFPKIKLFPPKNNNSR